MYVWYPLDRRSCSGAPCVHRKSGFEHRNADGEVPSFRAVQDPLDHGSRSVGGPVLSHGSGGTARSFSWLGRAVETVQLTVVV